MDDALWTLFWATGLPEAYALAKEKEKEPEEAQQPSPT